MVVLRAGVNPISKILGVTFFYFIYVLSTVNLTFAGVFPAGHCVKNLSNYMAWRPFFEIYSVLTRLC